MSKLDDKPVFVYDVDRTIALRVSVIEALTIAAVNRNGESGYYVLAFTDAEYATDRYFADHVHDTATTLGFFKSYGAARGMVTRLVGTPA